MVPEVSSGFGIHGDLFTDGLPIMSVSEELGTSKEFKAKSLGKSSFYIIASTP